MKVGFAQLNPTVGDLRGNFERILQSYERLAAAGADLVVTPELAITGYPPQDLVFKSRFVPETLEILEELHCRVEKAALLVGFVAGWTAARWRKCPWIVRRIIARRKRIAREGAR